METGESLVLVGAILVESRASVESRVSCDVTEEPSPLFIGPH